MTSQGIYEDLAMNDEKIGADVTDRSLQFETLLDRQHILDCLQRVCRGIDRFDRELFLSAFHPDALVDVGEFVIDAKTVFDGGKAAHEVEQKATQHHITNHVCELDGDTAHTETYLLYCGVNRDGTNLIAGARYIVRLERRDGQWRIAFRKILMEWSSLHDAINIPIPDNIADMQKNGVASRNRQDPSYRRPFTNLRTTPD